MNKGVAKINNIELQQNTSHSASWHQQYSHSSYVYVGNLPFALTEGDIIAVMSQYGEIVDLDLARDRESGKSRGFAFVCYEDQRSTILAVDNFNGIQILGRTLRVDHVDKYKPTYIKPGEEDSLPDEEFLKRKRDILPPHLRDDYIEEESDKETETIDEDPMKAYFTTEAKKHRRKKAKEDIQPVSSKLVFKSEKKKKKKKKKKES